MKVRVGFVANSSSSSFLLVGFDSKQFDELYPDKDPYEDFELDSVEGEDILGEQLLRFSECSIHNMDAKTLAEWISGTVARFEELGFKDIKAYYGEGY